MELKFKDDVEIRDITKFKSNTSILFTEFIDYCRKMGLPCKITSLISDRGNIKTKSTTHEDGRAFDCSVDGWSIRQIRECEIFFNKMFKNIAAISYSDGIARCCIYHDSGYGDHLHFQVRR